MRKTLQERFDDKWVPIPEAGCWVWTEGVTWNGYGRIQCDGKSKRAHRVSWEMHNGPLCGDAVVAHYCDTPSCVNPNHLFVTDTAGNLADMRAKGREARGEKSGKSKLTEEQVLAIRKDARFHYEIAKDYGVWQSSISRIKRRETWKHI